MLSYPHKLCNLPVIQETCRCGCVGDTVRELGAGEKRKESAGNEVWGGGEWDDCLHSYPQTGSPHEKGKQNTPTPRHSRQLMSDGSI